MDRTLFRKLLVADTDDMHIQLFRYAIVGGIAFVVDYAGLYLLTEYIHLHYLLSATLSFVAGLTVNYLIATHWVFLHRRLNSRIAEFLIYAIIGVIGVVLNDLLLWLLTEGMNCHYMLSKLGATLLVMIWNFFGRRIILFPANTK
ncbi:MAG: GtrA family protein [Bacteroidaceae bacterium]|nr:GtrA family protein [Bacteroidaceae bacterium]